MLYMNNEFQALLNFSKSYDENDLEKHTQAKGMWIVEGYAATSDLDSQNHIISQDALNMGAECLKRYETVLFNHDYDRPIGKIQSVESQPGKLFVKVAVSKTEPKLWEQVKDGTLSKFSISGRITDSETRKDEFSDKVVRIIKGMDLHEISLVSVPANVQAKSINYYVEKSMSKLEENDEVFIKVKTKTFMDAIKETVTDFLKFEKKEQYRHEGESVADCVQRKIKANIKDGMPTKQAVAAAHSMCGDSKKACEISVEDADTIIKSLSGELNPDIIKEIDEYFSNSIDDYKGGNKQMSEEVKKDEVKDEKPTEEKVEKSDNKEVSLNTSALKDVIVQLQDLAKSVTSQSEVVKALVENAKKDSEAIAKTKEEITKVFSDLNKLVEEIPLRKGQPAEDEKVEDRKDEQKDFTKGEDYQKARPVDRLGMLLNAGFNSNK